MIPFDEIDERLQRINKDRAWLAAESGRKINSIRVALAPNADPKNRSQLLQRALSEAIEREEKRQAGPTPPPGYSSIFLNDEQLELAERASRLGPWDSLPEFCRDAILTKANELIEAEARKKQGSYRSALRSLPSARVAEEPETKIAEGK